MQNGRAVHERRVFCARKYGAHSAIQNTDFKIFPHPPENGTVHILPPKSTNLKNQTALYPSSFSSSRIPHSQCVSSHSSFFRCSPSWSPAMPVSRLPNLSMHPRRTLPVMPTTPPYPPPAPNFRAKTSTNNPVSTRRPPSPGVPALSAYSSSFPSSPHFSPLYSPFPLLLLTEHRILGHVTAGEGALAAHSGGSCQASISFDNGVSWRVMHTYHGGCPRDVPYNSNLAGPNQTFTFVVPPQAKAGIALFSW